METWIEELSFAQRQRLQFIEAMLIWDGAVQRKDVCDVFNVTPNHLTREIKRYRTCHKGALEYDVETRSYRKGAKFKPLLASGSANEYLTLLQAYSSSNSSAIIPAIGHVVTAEALPMPSGQIDTEVLKSMVHAIKNGTGLNITYQSFRDANPLNRSIWAHTLVYTGERWHARAFDSLRQDYRDFVLTRILKAVPVHETTPWTSDEDADWTEHECIDVMAAPSLSETQKKVVEKEYGMRVGNLTMPTWSGQIRKCLVSYFLYRNRLEFGGNLDERSTEGQHPYLTLCEPELAAKYRYERE